MKRELVLGFCLLCLLRLPAPAAGCRHQCPGHCRQQCRRRGGTTGVDEKFKQIAADIESLRAANQILLDKLSALNNDLQQIRAEQARLAANAIGPRRPQTARPEN